MRSGCMIRMDNNIICLICTDWLNQFYQQVQRCDRMSTSNKKSQFKTLIQTLRKNTNFNENIEQQKKQLDIESNHKIVNVMPVTTVIGLQNKTNINGGGQQMEKTQLTRNCSIIIQAAELQLKEKAQVQLRQKIEIEFRQRAQLQLRQRVQAQIKQKSKEKQIQELQNPENRMKNSRLLRPQVQLALQTRSGQIKKQDLRASRPYNQYANSNRINPLKMQTNIMFPTMQAHASPPKMHGSSSQVFLLLSIKQINQTQMIKYWNSLPQLSASSSPQQISAFFETMVDNLHLVVREPMIKKYKNCIYFGQKIVQSLHQGMIHYFNGKLFYGELNNGIKHGYGVEINFEQDVRYAGQFKQGKKTGYFRAQKEKESYQGQLEYGLYHGQGKLMSQDCVYEGMFQSGKKHGFGQQFYPKTGFRRKGMYKDGNYQSLQNVKKYKQSAREILTHRTSEPIAKNINKLHSGQLKPYNNYAYSKAVALPQNDSLSLFKMLTHNSTAKQQNQSQESPFRHNNIRIGSIQFSESRSRGTATTIMNSLKQLSQGNQLRLPRHAYRSNQSKLNQKSAHQHTSSVDEAITKRVPRRPL